MGVNDIRVEDVERPRPGVGEAVIRRQLLVTDEVGFVYYPFMGWEDRRSRLLDGSKPMKKK